jgi:hypothetical protein
MANLAQKGSKRPEGVRLSIDGGGRRGRRFTICTRFTADSSPLMLSTSLDVPDTRKSSPSSQ